jgi:hypothetical protein
LFPFFVSCGIVPIFHNSVMVLVFGNGWAPDRLEGRGRVILI